MNTQAPQPAEPLSIGRNNAVLSLSIDDERELRLKYGEDVLARLRNVIQHTVQVASRSHQPRGFWQDQMLVIQLFDITRERLKAVQQEIRILLENACLVPGRENPDIAVSVGATLHAQRGNTLLAFEQNVAALKQCGACGGNCTADR